MNRASLAGALLLLNATRKFPPGIPPHWTWHALSTTCQSNLLPIVSWKNDICQLPEM